MATSPPVSKILVPLDGSGHSKKGLDYAIFLARHSNAIIIGVHVVPLTKPKPNEKISSLEKIFLRGAADIMSYAKTRCAKKGIMFEDVLLYGDEGPEISKYAKKHGFDMVVIGSRGRSSAKEIFLGSTSNYVLHKLSLPVLVIK